MGFQRCYECQGVNGHMPACSQARPVAAEEDRAEREEFDPSSALPAPENSDEPTLLQIRRIPRRPPPPREDPILVRHQQQQLQVRAAGRRNMMVGGLWLSGGALFTAASFARAMENTGSGSYVALGALVFGAAQFCKGLAQTLR